MFDWFEYTFLNLSNSKNRIFLKLFGSKNFINIFTEVHPLDSFFSATNLVNSISSDNLLVFLVSEAQIERVQNFSELYSSHYIFSETVIIKEKLSDSQSFESNLCLYFS